MVQDAIILNNVSVYYKKNCVLSNIDLRIAKKDFLAVIGPNGGGKSTLLKIMLGLIKPTRGSVSILGKTPENAKGVIGYVPQNIRFKKDFPIKASEVILMGMLGRKKKYYTKFSSKDYELLNALIENLKLQDIMNKLIGELSGGQLQKVLIARAMAQQPEILFLDEPTASLDSENKSNIFSLLKELNEKLTIVIVTHEMSALCSYVKNIACLNKKLFYHGEPELQNRVVNNIFGCPIDLIAHGVPHRVLKMHEENIL